ncbi:MAG: glycosyltransferase family 2 protein [Bacteroides sp.]|nr:glycosyltransferase family 2 protein [Bacteroides sp.]
MTPISATILTFNEERSIEQCLRSLEDVADEIIVVDACSTDRTAEICRQWPHCRVAVRPMNGYGAQRQYATSLASYDYVLAIDADEALSPSLRNEIIRLKKQGLDHRGYSFSRLNFYCGIPVKHSGWYPDTQIRLFDRRYANWNLNDVAEKVIFRDSVTPCPIDGDILHYRCNSPQEYEQTEMAHAALRARLIAASGNRPGALRPLWEGMKAFVDCYIGSRAILDGEAGRQISVRRFRSARHAFNLARRMMDGKK